MCSLFFLFLFTLAPRPYSGVHSGEMLAGDDAHALSPKQKKRRKHQEFPSQAGPSALSAEAPAAPANNAQHRTAANSPAANGLAHRAATHSPAVAQAAATSTPTADQNAANGPPAQQPAAVIQNGVADSQQGTVSLWSSLQQNVTAKEESVTHDISNGLSRQILVAHVTRVAEPKVLLCKTVHMHQSTDEQTNSMFKWLPAVDSVWAQCACKRWVRCTMTNCLVPLMKCLLCSNDWPCTAADGKKVKQKAHKKKKREIDKPAASPVTASAHPGELASAMHICTCADVWDYVLV